MVDVKFKVIHRIILRGIVDSDGKSGQHALSELSKMLKVQEIVSFPEAEAKEFNIRVEEGAFRWNSKRDNSPEGEEIDVEKPFSFSDEQKDLICDIIKRKSEAKEFSLSEASPVMEIAEQFGLVL